MAKIIQEGQRWLVSGGVDFNNASHLFETSLSFDHTGPIVIDLKQVTSVDTSAVSLMLEWTRLAVAANTRVTFVNLSANLISLTNLYGVTEFIAQN